MAVRIMQQRSRPEVSSAALDCALAPTSLQSFTLSASEMCDWFRVEGTARQRLAQTLVGVIQAFPAIGHGLSGSKTQRSQNTGVLERSFLDRQTFWNKAFGTKRCRW
jgi:hypothetical protein